MKASDSYRIKLGFVSALGVLSLVSAATLALATTAPQMRVPGLDSLGVGAEARANLAARDAGQNPAAAARALAANRASLDSAPMNAAAWMRLAYLRSLDGKPLDQDSLSAVENSYSVAPFGPDVTVWRIGFLYQHWNELPAELRKEVGMETGVGDGWKLDLKTISNPSGELAATFYLADRVRRYERSQAAARAAGTATAARAAAQ